MDSKRDDLSARMRRYEEAFRFRLPRRTYTLVRLDGCRFRSHTAGMHKPFDLEFIEAMREVALFLADRVDGVVFGFVASDEISLLLQDFATHNIEPWLGGVLPKMVSVSAAMATARYAQVAPASGTSPAWFDSRVWTMTDPVEVANYFVSRQRSTVHNSVTMAATAICNDVDLTGLSTAQRQELLFSRGVNWNDYPVAARRGSVVVRRPAVPGQIAERETWQALEAPILQAAADSWLAAEIPAVDSLRG